MVGRVAQQGHLYQLHGQRVIAVSDGCRPRVVPLLKLWGPDMPDFFGAPIEVDAALLKPLPMRYYHGETPR